MGCSDTCRKQRSAAALALMPFVACVSRGCRMIQASVDQATAPPGPGGACGSPSRAPQARRAPAL